MNKGEMNKKGKNDNTKRNDDLYIYIISQLEKLYKKGFFFF